MCLFEVWCLTMLKLCSRSVRLSLRSTAQPFEQGDLVVGEASIYWILYNFVWFIALVSRNTDFADCHQSHTMCTRMNWRTSEAKLRWSRVTIGLSSQVWKWNCLSAPRRVPQLVDGLYYYWRALNMKVSVQNKHGLIFLAQSKLIAIWLLVLAGLNLLIQVESSPRMMGFVAFGQEFSRVLHTFGTDTSSWEERRCVRDAVPRRDAFLVFSCISCAVVGWLKRNNQRFSKQKWDGNIDKVLGRCATRLHEVDHVMLSMQDSLFDFHRAPRFVKGALHQYVGIQPTACIIFPVKLTFISIQLSISASLHYIYIFVCAFVSCPETPL